MTRLAMILLCTLALGACQQGSAPDAAAPDASVGGQAATEPLDQPEEAVPPATAESLAEASLDSVLAGDWRSDANKARDQYRHPRETLEFFQVRPGQRVIEITPGAGWYAEVLAPWLAAGGEYVAAVEAGAPDSYAARMKATLEELFAAHPDQFGEAETVEFDGSAPVFGPPGSADRVLTFRNVHNWAMGGTAAGMFKGFFDVLKPGGVLGVVDHRADAGATLDEVKDSGYLPLDYVVKLATDAGFELDAESEINANPNDDHHHAKGVWTLPPTFRLGDEDREKYLVIGESDRMTLRFIKPKPDQIHSTGMDRGDGTP